ncbi:MAG: hypothetical protein CMO80_23940 [Verrucomicrobiales bacterium]|nr:hypothetical protein [Verrucomicrobiales bacterium]|tara:strand:- start:13230 stop:14057 length:828 start_codon:yes stop_codon:yes gene_type:complete
MQSHNIKNPIARLVIKLTIFCSVLFLLFRTEIDRWRQMRMPLPELREGKTILEDDFESGDLADFWMEGDRGEGRYEAGAMVITNTFVHAGESALQITVREGDIPQIGSDGLENERAEMDSGKHPYLGTQKCYRFAFLVPQDFPVVDVRLVISQIKQRGKRGGPIVAQRFVNDTHTVVVDDDVAGFKRRYDLPAIEREVWHEMEYSIGYSTGDDGFIQILMNGKEVVRYQGPTAIANNQNEFYHKFGLYRDRMKEPMTIYFDDFKISELEIVKPTE